MGPVLLRRRSFVGRGRQRLVRRYGDESTWYTPDRDVCALLAIRIRLAVGPVPTRTRVAGTCDSPLSTVPNPVPNRAG